MMTKESEDARVSFRMSQKEINDFDDKIIQLKAEQELDRDVTRSDLIRRLMRAWIEGNCPLPPNSRRETMIPHSS